MFGSLMGRDGYPVWLSRRAGHNSVLWHTTKIMETTSRSTPCSHADFLSCEQHLAFCAYRFKATRASAARYLDVVLF